MDMQLEQRLCVEGVRLRERVDSMDFSNFLDIERLSSSRNSCDEEAFESEVDHSGEPYETRPSKCLCLREQFSNKHLRISSIGNWLQCRQVIKGFGECVDGSICGKW